MSNTERSRLFRKRHPNYDARRKATQRASTDRDLGILLARAAMPALPVEVEPIQSAATAEPVRMPLPVEPMLLLLLAIAGTSRQSAHGGR